MEKSNEHLAIAIRWELNHSRFSEDSWLTFHGRFVTIDLDKSMYTKDYSYSSYPSAIKNISDYVFDNPFVNYYNLTLKDQCTIVTETGLPKYGLGFSAEPYGLLRYRDCDSISAELAERMSKTLRSIEKKEAKITERQGSSKSFGDIVGRVAQAAGAKYFVYERGENWIRASVGDAIDFIDGVIYTLNNQGVEKIIEQKKAVVVQ